MDKVCKTVPRTTTMNRHEHTWLKYATPVPKRALPSPYELLARRELRLLCTLPLAHACIFPGRRRVRTIRERSSCKVVTLGLNQHSPLRTASTKTSARFANSHWIPRLFSPTEIPPLAPRRALSVLEGESMDNIQAWYGILGVVCVLVLQGASNIYIPYN